MSAGAANPTDDPEAPVRPSLNENSTPQEEEEYFLSNFSYIMFSKPTIDRLIEEIKLTSENGISQEDIDAAVEIANTLYKFDYAGCTNVDMPGITMHDEVVNKKYDRVAIRFRLQLMPEDYKLNFSIPKQHHKNIQKSIEFLQFGVIEFSKHFITANLSVMNEIRAKTQLKLENLQFDKTTIGLYFDNPKGQQIHVKYDFYTNDESGNAGSSNNSDDATEMENID